MSDNIATQLLVIQQLLEQGKVGEALAEVQVIIARYPEQGKAQAMLGSIYLHHLADFTAAEEAFRIAMRQAAILEIKQKTENGGKCQMLELPENNKLTAMYLLSWHNDR
jgi:Tfp pilus assembly protein PilF